MIVPRSRKGIVGLSLTQTIGLILAVGFIIMSIAVVSGLLNIFTGPPDQGTLNMYSRVVSSLEVMTNPANNNDTCKILNAYIEPNYALVGFNKEGESNVDGKTGKEGDEDWGYIEETCGVVDDDIYKPDECLDLACLCLCDGGTGDVTGDDCSDENSRCMRADRSVRQFVLKQGGERKDLVVYGESCWGGDRHVIAGYVLRKESGGVISIEEVMTKDDMDAYAKIPECEDMARDFRRGEERPEQPQQAQNDVGKEINRIEKKQGVE